MISKLQYLCPQERFEEKKLSFEKTYFDFFWFWLANVLVFRGKSPRGCQNSFLCVQKNTLRSIFKKRSSCSNNIGFCVKFIEFPDNFPTGCLRFTLRIFPVKWIFFTIFFFVVFDVCKCFTTLSDFFGPSLNRFRQSCNKSIPPVQRIILRLIDKSEVLF